MRKPKRVARGFQILKLEDSLEDDFECLGSNSVDDASSTFTNSSSDDDWSIVDSDVDDGDVIYSPSTSHADGNGVDQREARSTIGSDDFSKERHANLKKEDAGARANKITPVDDWISLGEPSTPALAVDEVLVEVGNFAARNNFDESDDKSPLDELGQSDESIFCDDFVSQNDSTRELPLECVEFVVIERNGNGNHDVELDEFICSDDSNLLASVEMLDSDSDNGREDSEAGKDYSEKEMFFPYVEIPESEFTIEEVIQETDEGREITHGGVEPSDDHFMIEDESSDDFSDYLIAPEGYWCDPDTLLEIKCNEPENFLKTNDLYDFFPTRYCPLKFDRYGSRHRKRQKRVIDADKCWRKMYYYY